MSFDDLKSELLSALESEHTGRLLEIDKRLRERKILITGYRVDSIKKVVGVKIDVMRELRSQEELLRFGKHGSAWFLEEIMAGIPGYVIVIDSHLEVHDLAAGPDMQMESIITIEHTYVLHDGKYLCEYGDAANPLHAPAPRDSHAERLREFRRIIDKDENGMPRITYNL